MAMLGDTTPAVVPLSVAPVAVVPTSLPPAPPPSFASDFMKGIQFSPLAPLMVTSLIAQPQQTWQSFQAMLKNNPGTVVGGALPWVALIVWLSSRKGSK